MTDYSGVNDAYGKNGTITNSQKFRNSQYMLDDNTRKQLEYIVSGKAEFDDSLITDAKKELDYWNSIVPITGGGYSSNAQFAYNAQLKAIEEQRKYQEQLAEQARQDAIKNAYTTYDRSLPTFGQNAERLAQMGLTNSGYSDYLGGVAYSSMVGGVQDAHKTANKAIQDAYYNAELQKAQAADTLYNRQLAESQIAYDREQDKAKIDAETKAAYDTNYRNALALATEGKLGDGAGNVSLEAIMAAGFTETDANTLIDVNTSAYGAKKGKEESDKFTTFSLEIYKALNEGPYKPNEIMSIIDSSDFTDVQKEILIDDVKKHIAEMQEGNYENYIIEIKNGSLDTSLVDRALEKEEISPDHYGDLKRLYNENIDKTETFFSDVSYEDAKTALDNVINNSWVDEAIKDALNKAYTKVYAREIAREVAGISISDNAKVVDINSSNYKKSDLGKNIDDPKSPQGKYLTAIAADAKAGKIKVGQTIQTDLGIKDAIYVYIGEGLFVKATWRTHVNQYLPKGYYTYSSNGDVKVGVAPTYESVVGAGSR